MKNFVVKLTAFAYILLFVFTATPAAEAAHKGTVTYTLELQNAEKAKDVRLWLPYPFSDAFQSISDIEISGDHQTLAVYKDPKNGAAYLAASWKNPQTMPLLTFRFTIDSHYSKLQEIQETDAPFPVEVLPYLKGSESLPANDPLFATLAQKLKGEHSVLKRARHVYDWVIANTHRDNNVKGCGIGLPIRTLNEMKGGGKCADISAVFVTVARAAGIPARDVYGLRMASPKNGEITGDFHCWAEFYLPGTGWVPVDPADVRKAMLVEKLELKDAGKWVEFFWGGDDLFRIALSRDAREMVFSPATASSPLTYFMYPYAEIDGKALDYFGPKDFKYTVTLELR